MWCRAMGRYWQESSRPRCTMELFHTCYLDLRCANVSLAHANLVKLVQGDGAVLAGELQNLHIRTQSLPPHGAPATAATGHVGASSAPTSPSHIDPGHAQVPPRMQPGRANSRRGSGHSNRSISDTRLKKFHLLLNESSVRSLTRSC